VRPSNAAFLRALLGLAPHSLGRPSRRRDACLDRPLRARSASLRGGDSEQVPGGTYADGAALDQRLFFDIFSRLAWATVARGLPVAIAIRGRGPAPLSMVAPHPGHRRQQRELARALTARRDWTLVAAGQATRYSRERLFRARKRHGAAGTRPVVTDLSGRGSTGHGIAPAERRTHPSCSDGENRASAMLGIATSVSRPQNEYRRHSSAATGRLEINGVDRHGASTAGRAAPREPFPLPESSRPPRENCTESAMISNQLGLLSVRRLVLAPSSRPGDRTRAALDR